MENLKEEISQSIVSQILHNTDETRIEKNIGENTFSIGSDDLDIISHPKQDNEYQLKQFTIVGLGRNRIEASGQLLDKEAKLCFKLLFKAVMSNVGDNRPRNKISIIKEENFKESLEQLQYEVEKHRLLVDKFFVNRSELGLFKKNINAIDYDPPTSKESLHSGILGSLWGVNIFVDSNVDEYGYASICVPEGIIFAITEGRYLGRKKIYDIDVFESENKCIIVCKMGMTIVNPRAVAVSSTLRNLNISLKENLI